MPTPAALFGAIVFGSIGMAAFVYGRKSSLLKPVVIGIALMGFPYFVSETWALFAVGAALSGALFIFRD